MKMSLLCAKSLSIGYINKNKNTVIAKSINLDLQKGQLIALIGANGVGKSTLLRTLIGVQKPLKGNIFLNKKDILTYNAQSLAQNLSIVLTEKLPPNNLTVFELVALGRQPYTNWLGILNSSDLEQIKFAINLTQTENLLHKKLFEISDGQLQKVLIARALAQNTPLIVLDEPTTHLDLPNKIALFKLLKKITENTQKGIIFSTHDIDLALEVSHEMIVMTPENCFQNTPQNLIEQGVLSNLFEKQGVFFDKKTRRFF